MRTHLVALKHWNIVNHLGSTIGDVWTSDDQSAEEALSWWATTHQTTASYLITDEIETLSQ